MRTAAAFNSDRDELVGETEQDEVDDGGGFPRLLLDPSVGDFVELLVEAFDHGLGPTLRNANS